MSPTMPMHPRFHFHAAPLNGVWKVERKPLGDERGYFARLFCAEAFDLIGLKQPWVQMNESFTRLKGSVRGLHFQHPPHAEHKLITVMQGRILDFAVDLRRGSPTYLHAWSIELSSEEPFSLLIPPGCAHGFQTLESDCRLLYLHTAPHTPAAEGGIHLHERRLRPGPLHLPLPITDMSERDRQWPTLPENFEGLDT